MKAALKFIVLFLVLGLVVYLVITSFYRNPSVSQEETPESANNKNAFTDLTQSTYKPTLDHFNTIFTTDDYWQTWDIQTDMIGADVVKVFPDTNELSLDIFLPNNEFSGINRVVANCTSASNVLLSSKNRKFIKGNFDLFSEVKKDDILYANCLDDSCNNIGKECVLIHKDI